MIEFNEHVEERKEIIGTAEIFTVVCIEGSIAFGASKGVFCCGLGGVKRKRERESE